MTIEGDNPPVEWQGNCVLLMLRVIENHPDPDEWFDAWLDEAGPVDVVYVEYAMKTWEEVRNMNFLDRLRLERSVRSVLYS